MKSFLSQFLSSPSLHSTDAAPRSSGNPQWPGGDDIIPEQLWLTQYSVFYSNHIAMSFPISSGHLNPLIIHQQHWSGVYRKSPVYLVLCCTLSLMLINLCGGRALQAFTATVMRLCLVLRPCRTNADGLYGCRSGLALTHSTVGGRGKFHLQDYETIQHKVIITVLIWATGKLHIIASGAQKEDIVCNPPGF